MERRLVVVAVAIIGGLSAVGEGVDFNAGADLRIRQEMMDNVPGMPEGGLLMPRARRNYTNHVRFRPRVWGEMSGVGSDAVGKWRIHTRLTDEMRWYVTPKNNAYTWPDEVIVDNLFLEGVGVWDGLLDLCVGRQDIYGLYGLDHVFVDGTPGDGSRTTYADVARFALHATEESRLDVFGIYNEDDNVLRWGTDRGNHRSMCGIAPGKARDMDDWGYGVVWNSNLGKELPYQVFAMQKNTRSFKLNGVKHPKTRRELLGAKIVPQLTEELSVQLEGMGQVGENGEHDDLHGWSGYVGLNWKRKCEGWRPFAKIGYHYMSGDEDAANEDGGHGAWDPMWARGVNDSELFLYGTHYGVAWWSNMHYLKNTVGIDIGAHHRLIGSMGPIFADAKDGMGGGDGSFKGYLSQARYDFPLWLAGEGERFEIFGHVLAELFNPGDYFESSKPAWFLRWQIEIKF